MGREFQILIKNLSGKIFPVDVNANMSVGDLKRKIYNNKVFSDCILKFGAILMNNDDMTIDSLGVNDNSTIYMLARLNGGI